MRSSALLRWSAKAFLVVLFVVTAFAAAFTSASAQTIVMASAAYV